MNTPKNAETGGNFLSPPTDLPPQVPELEPRGLRVPCPECGKLCLPAGLAIHRYRAHTKQGIVHTGRLAQASRGNKHAARRGKYASKEEARLARNKIAREKYAQRKGKLEPQEKVVEAVKPQHLNFCPECGANLHVYNTAMKLAQRFSNGHHKE